MKKRIVLLLSLAIMLPCTGAQAAPASGKQQSISELDNMLAKLLSKLSEQAGAGDSDKVASTNQLFITAIKAAMSDPKLLSASLPKSKEAGLTKLSSADGKVCFYSWDTQTGGTMHFYRDFVQFKTSKAAAYRDLNPPAKEEGDLATGYFYHDLHSVVTSSSKPVYMPTYRSIFSNQDHSDGITAYSIEGDKLIEVPFFKTKTKTLKSISVPAIEVEWNDNGLINFKDQNKTLLIPITVKDGGATGRFLTYRFNGQYFVFDEKAREKPKP